MCCVLLIYLYKHIEAWTQWNSFHERYFDEMYSLEVVSKEASDNN